MKRSMIEETRDKCIECNRCTNNCIFLDKYLINLKDFTNRSELKMSCFLCDKCKNVCPVNLSGREIALEMRRINPKDGKITEFMKNDYKLKNNSDKKSHYLLFLGCNYPGVYPKTCEKLIDICKEMGIDYSVDCCKKPVEELGRDAKFSNILDLLNKKQTKVLIAACPNCYHTLKGRLEGVEVIDVYKFLKDRAIGEKIEETPSIFFPCSDRYNKEIFSSIEYFINDYKDTYNSVNCCGLGGGAAKREKDLIEKTGEKMRQLNDGTVYTYCSSCSSIFRKYQLKGIKNILSEILSVHEEPSDKYLENVLKFKFKGRR